MSSCHTNVEYIPNAVKVQILQFVYIKFNLKFMLRKSFFVVSNFIKNKENKGSQAAYQHLTEIHTFKNSEIFIAFSSNVAGKLHQN